MLRTPQSYRTQKTRPVLIRLWLLGVATVMVTACGDNSDRPAVVDLMAELTLAEVRPGPGAATVDLATFDGDSRLALVLRPPSRVIWSLTLPRRAELRTAVAGFGQVRVGISDDRRYEELGRVTATGTWTPVTVDLSAYSDWKWSLFFQPLRRDWHVVLSADPAAADQIVALDRPSITKS